MTSLRVFGGREHTGIQPRHSGTQVRHFENLIERSLTREREGAKRCERIRSEKRAQSGHLRVARHIRCPRLEIQMLAAQP